MKHIVLILLLAAFMPLIASADNWQPLYESVVNSLWLPAS